MLCISAKGALTESERSFAGTFSQYVALAKARQAADHALRESEENIAGWCRCCRWPCCRPRDA